MNYNNNTLMQLDECIINRMENMEFDNALLASKLGETMDEIEALKKENARLEIVVWRQYEVIAKLQATQFSISVN